MSASWMRAPGLIIVSAWLAAGCSAAKKIDVGGSCVLNSDCSGSLVCTWGKCHATCHTSADCPTGQSCIIASDQATVCKLPVEAAAPPADASVDVLAASVDSPSAMDSLHVTPDAVAAEAVLRIDASVPFDVASANDSLPVTPDVIAVEAATRMDAVEAAPRMDAAEAAKPVDAVAFDSGKPVTDLAPAMLGEMSPTQLHDALANKDFLLIDVHYPNAGSIPGTDARIAYNDIPALVAFIGPNLDSKVVLTCLSGGMSKQAGDALVARGYRNISELAGGMNAWTAAGYPLVHLDGGM